MPVWLVLASAAKATDKLAEQHTVTITWCQAQHLHCPIHACVCHPLQVVLRWPNRQVQSLVKLLLYQAGKHERGSITDFLTDQEFGQAWAAMFRTKVGQQTACTEA